MIQYLVHVLQNMDTSNPVETITTLRRVHPSRLGGRSKVTGSRYSLLSPTSNFGRSRRSEIQVHSNEGCLEDITGLDPIERGFPGLLSRRQHYTLATASARHHSLKQFVHTQLVSGRRAPNMLATSRVFCSSLR
jgi:hypothetical protein